MFLRPFAANAMLPMYIRRCREKRGRKRKREKEKFDHAAIAYARESKLFSNDEKLLALMVGRTPVKPSFIIDTTLSRPIFKGGWTMIPYGELYIYLSADKLLEIY